MAVMYYISYYGSESDVKHECEIDVPDYEGSPIDVRGFVIHEQPEVENVLEAIRGSKVSLSLEANQNRNFEELFKQEERINKVTYKRNGEINFTGYIKPDGCYRDFVNKEWVITLEATDGLGLLKNLSYDWLTGGIEKEIVVLARALHRTGLNLDIYTNLNVTYDGQPSGTDVLDNVYINQNRFVKEDSMTGMDSETVIRSILEKYGASIFQYKGSWVVSSLMKKSVDPESFYKYDFEGSYVTNISMLPGITIGSDVNDFPLFHCNEDQSIETAPSLGAVRINFKYGFLDSFNDNPWMINDGQTLPGWNIISAPRVALHPNNTVDILYEQGTTIGNALEFPEMFELKSGEILQIKTIVGALNGAHFNKTTTLPMRALQVYVYAHGTNDTWSLNGLLNDDSDPLNWEPSTGYNVGAYFKGGVYMTFEKNAPALQEDVMIEVRIAQLWELNPENDPPRALRLNYFGIGIAPADDEKIVGEFHDFQRKSKASSITDDVIEMSVGDVSGDAYSGALYQNDGDTLTTDWNIDGQLVGGILQVMGELIMRAHQKPADIFSGSVFGNVDYPGPLIIDGVPGKFVMKSRKYNTKTGVSSLISQEIFDKEIPDGISYSRYSDYGGNKVEPTIEV